MTHPLSIIGFSGRPIRDGAAWKLPIVYDVEREKAYLEQRPAGLWDMDELRHFQEEGRLCLFQAPRPFKPNHVAVCLHHPFVHPPKRGPTLTPIHTLDFEESFESYVSIVSRDTAIELYRTWSEFLIQAAKRELSVGDPDTAAETARRAQFTVLAEPLRELLRETHILLFAAWTLGGKDTEALFEDAVRDFPESEVSLMAQQGATMARDVLRRRRNVNQKPNPWRAQPATVSAWSNGVLLARKRSGHRPPLPRHLQRMKSKV